MLRRGVVLAVFLLQGTFHSVALRSIAAVVSGAAEPALAAGGDAVRAGRPLSSRRPSRMPREIKNSADFVVGLHSVVVAEVPPLSRVFFDPPVPLVRRSPSLGAQDRGRSPPFTVPS